MAKSEKHDGGRGRAPHPRSRALSLRAARWQPALAALLLLAVPAQARPLRGGLDGPIGTLHRGDYLCEQAGNALGEAGVHQADEDFTILHDSAYRSATGSGSYLLTGKLVVMTSGPKRGERFHRLSDSFLRQLGPDGGETSLRCVRSVLNNAH